MSKVSIIRCNEYDIDMVSKAISKSLDNLGGLETLIPKNSSVFIKLNCVGPFDKDLGITTHPVVTEAVIKEVLKQTSNITIGDNPAVRDISFVLKKNGNLDIINKYNLKVLNGKDLTTKITNPHPHIYNEFEVSKEMIDADVLINLPKLKTHTLTYMTCAQKNFFGLIFGLQKASWHVKASNPLEFGEALNDLYGALLNSYKNKKIIHICDGILGLDGDGPSTGGIASKANVILASLDAISLDTVACDIVKLDKSKLFVTNIAAERNYGDNKNIEYLGDSITDFTDISFSGPKNTIGNFGLRLLRHKIFRNLLLEHPIIDHSKCIRCGECAKICPPKTMVIKKGEFPHLSSNNCIRCWCCAEVCPQNAIQKSKRPIIGRIAF